MIISHHIISYHIISYHIIYEYSSSHEIQNPWPVTVDDASARKGLWNKPGNMYVPATWRAFWESLQNDRPPMTYLKINTLNVVTRFYSIKWRHPAINPYDLDKWISLVKKTLRLVFCFEQESSPCYIGPGLTCFLVDSTKTRGSKTIHCLDANSLSWMWFILAWPTYLGWRSWVSLRQMSLGRDHQMGPIFLGNQTMQIYGKFWWISPP